MVVVFLVATDIQRSITRQKKNYFYIKIFLLNVVSTTGKRMNIPLKP
jgi:hypothetical protein